MEVLGLRAIRGEVQGHFQLTAADDNGHCQGEASQKKSKKKIRLEYMPHMAMGQNPVPPVNIPIPTEID